MTLTEVMYIFYAVNGIRKTQCIKPSTAKVYQYLKKLDKNFEGAHFKSTLKFLLKILRGRSRAAATSKTKLFVIIDNG